MTRLLKSVGFGVSAISLLAAGSGCDWRKFEDAVEKAPVLSVKPPGGYLGNDVGRLVVALPPPADQPEVSARFFMASITKVSAAVVDLDAAGKPTVYNVPDTVLAPLISTPMGSVALAQRPDEGFPSVLLGVPEFKTADFKNGAVFRLKIQPGTPPLFVLDQAVLPLPTLAVGGKSPQFAGLQGFGRGVASGPISGNPSFDDWVVVGNAGVALIEDGAAITPALVTPASECGIDFNPLRTDHLYTFSRNPAVGDLIPGLPGGEIAVGAPDATTTGKVVILNRDPAAPALGCPVILSMPGSPGFGSAVLTGDLNGDGVADLVVGAPPEQVFVFFGPFTVGVPPMRPLVIPAPMGAQTTDFGSRLALMELDALPGPELMVSAPGYPSAGTNGAGAVFAFKLDGTQLPISVADHNPSALSNLGEGLAVVPFRNARCTAGQNQQVLVAGANEEVFTYFMLPNLLPDPRCFPTAK